MQSFLFIPGICLKDFWIGLKAHRVVFWNGPACWSWGCLEHQNSLWFLLLKRQKAISLPSIHGFYLLQTSQSWETLGKVEELRAGLLGRATGGQQVELSFCDRETLTPRPVPSLNFTEVWTGKNGSGEMWRIGGEHYLSFGPQGRVTEGCCCLTPAWLMRDELSDVPYFRREGWCRRSRYACL